MNDTNAPSAVTSEPVQLRLPADPSMSRVLRLATSGLASLHGFTIDEVEDLKLAVSEVLIVLIEHGAGHPVDVNVQVNEARFQIDASTERPDFDPNDPDLTLCRTVLDSVCTFHEIQADGTKARIRAVVGRSDG
jgi:anti-sigma regulatory factor (Ser/Thr protein kinase)